MAARSTGGWERSESRCKRLTSVWRSRSRRPTSYADGVVVADALCWHDADTSTLALLGVPDEAVARALLFRMATTIAVVTTQGAAADVTEVQRYAHAAAVLGI